MTVLEDSVRVGTRLSGLVDIACAVHRPDISAMLVEWLGRRPDGHVIVDCTDDFQVVFIPQDRNQSLAHNRVIVHYEHANHESAVAGTRAVTRVPLPALLLTWRRPPSSLARSRMPTSP